METLRPVRGGGVLALKPSGQRKARAFYLFYTFYFYTFYENPRVAHAVHPAFGTRKGAVPTVLTQPP